MAADDPIDEARTYNARAGEVMKESRGYPGYVLIAVAAGAFVACLVAAATGHHAWMGAWGAVALISAIIGSIWTYRTRRHNARQAVQLLDDPRRAGMERQAPAKGRRFTPTAAGSVRRRSRPSRSRP
jgi:hypothetical protein